MLQATFPKQVTRIECQLCTWTKEKCHSIQTNVRAKLNYYAKNQAMDFYRRHYNEDHCDEAEAEAEVTQHYDEIDVEVGHGNNQRAARILMYTAPDIEARKNLMQKYPGLVQDFEQRQEK